MEKPLREVVPFAKGQQYYEKYRPMTPDTFGCDIEFHAERQPTDAADHKDEIIRDMTLGAQWNENRSSYYEWLENKRKDSNRRYTWNRDWNDDYGPIDPDTWLQFHEEPERSSFNTDEEFQEKFDEWENEKSDVEYQHRRWERMNVNDYTDAWAEEMFSNNEWENYSTFEIPNISDVESEISEVVGFLQHDLGQSAEKGETATVTTWAVGEDANGVVEIRTRHMNDTAEDYDLIKKILAYVQYKKTGGDTSAHVHIGLPKDFTAFDILAMADLVDEKRVQLDVGKDRDWGRFSQMAYELHGYILNVVSKNFGVEQDKLETLEKLHPGWTISDKDMLSVINKIARYMGTNLVAYFIHGTVEFRYFSSDVARRNPGLFISWIKYFMTIPKISKRRNSFVVGRGRVGALKFERKPNGDIRIKFDEYSKSYKFKDLSKSL
jgi:septum formation topological specificity factor MinE